MQDPRMLPSEDVPKSKPRKRSSATPKASKASKASNFQIPRNDMQDIQQLNESTAVRMPKKPTKKKNKKEASPVFQQMERSNSDSLPDSSTSGNEYRALRRKYLLLEEESFGLGKELKDVEDDVGALEKEKLALLDQLVVLEGLVDPSEIQYR
ncbi:LOW QUALITY PROTEIN: uncharacterized protein LOC110807297 [Carica papaya]|uniref:LOW QUALITY PROTEIN: uncharacterized protein LOC110807297 n=1 Tax=Carica papaya TaxID=3649 RepID=UPI000B8C9661|nr:LOW QUALITY PROTEIN: uncharacterized protein LOC110807297 [Carica papaya]